MIPLLIDRYGLGNVEKKAITLDGTYPVNSVGELVKFEGEEQTQYTVKPDQTSYLNTVVFSDMLLEYNGRQVYFDTVLFDISQSKNIVTTSLQGRDGTVKEYISDGDFIITIKAIVTSPQSRNYPEDQMRNIKEMMKVKDALVVVSPILQLFDIDNIVVKDYRFPSNEGYTNTQAVEITALSDHPLELILDDKTNI